MACESGGMCLADSPPGGLLLPPHSQDLWQRCAGDSSRILLEPKKKYQEVGKSASSMQRHIDMERALFQEKAILRAREALVSRSGQVGSAQACPRAR